MSLLICTVSSLHHTYFGILTSCLDVSAESGIFRKLSFTEEDNKFGYALTWPSTQSTTLTCGGVILLQRLSGSLQSIVKYPFLSNNFCFVSYKSCGNQMKLRSMSDCDIQRMVACEVYRKDDVLAWTAFWMKSNNIFSMLCAAESMIGLSTGMRNPPPPPQL